MKTGKVQVIIISYANQITTILITRSLIKLERIYLSRYLQRCRSGCFSVPIWQTKCKMLHWYRRSEAGMCSIPPDHNNDHQNRTKSINAQLCMIRHRQYLTCQAANKAEIHQKGLFIFGYNFNILYTRIASKLANESDHE